MFIAEIKSSFANLIVSKLDYSAYNFTTTAPSTSSASTKIVRVKNPRNIYNLLGISEFAMYFGKLASTTK